MLVNSVDSYGQRHALSASLWLDLLGLALKHWSRSIINSVVECACGNFDHDCGSGYIQWLDRKRNCVAKLDHYLHLDGLWRGGLLTRYLANDSDSHALPDHQCADCQRILGRASVCGYRKFRHSGLGHCQLHDRFHRPLS